MKNKRKIIRILSMVSTLVIFIAILTSCSILFKNKLKAPRLIYNDHSKMLTWAKIEGATDYGYFINGKEITSNNEQRHIYLGKYIGKQEISVYAFDSSGKMEKSDKSDITVYIRVKANPLKTLQWYDSGNLVIRIEPVQNSPYNYVDVKVEFVKNDTLVKEIFSQKDILIDKNYEKLIPLDLKNNTDGEYRTTIIYSLRDENKVPTNEFLDRKIVKTFKAPESLEAEFKNYKLGDGKNELINFKDFESSIKVPIQGDFDSKNVTAYLNDQLLSLEKSEYSLTHANKHIVIPKKTYSYYGKSGDNTLRLLIKLENQKLPISVSTNLNIIDSSSPEVQKISQKYIIESNTNFNFKYMSYEYEFISAEMNSINLAKVVNVTADKFNFKSLLEPSGKYKTATLKKNLLNIFEISDITKILGVVEYKLNFKRTYDGVSTDFVYDGKFNVISTKGPTLDNIVYYSDTYKNSEASGIVSIPVNLFSGAEKLANITKVKTQGGIDITSETNMNIVNNSGGSLELSTRFLKRYDLGALVEIAIQFDGGYVDKKIHLRFIDHKPIKSNKGTYTILDTFENTKDLFVELNNYSGDTLDRSIIGISIDDNEYGRVDGHGKIYTDSKSTSSLFIKNSFLRSLKDGKHRVGIMYEISIGGINKPYATYFTLNTYKKSFDDYSINRDLKSVNDIYEIGWNKILGAASYKITNLEASEISANKILYEGPDNKFDFNVRNYLYEGIDRVVKTRIEALDKNGNTLLEKSQNISILSKLKSKYLKNNFTLHGKVYSQYIDTEEKLEAIIHYFLTYGGLYSELSLDPTFNNKYEILNFTSSGAISFNFYLNLDLSFDQINKKFEAYLDTYKEAYKFKGYSIRETATKKLYLVDANEMVSKIKPVSEKTPGNTQTEGKYQETNFAKTPRVNPIFPIDSYKKTEAFITYPEELVYVIQQGKQPLLKPNSEAEKIYNQAKGILKNIISDDMSQFEKFTAIAQWIATNAIYDTEIANRAAGIPTDSAAYDEFYTNPSFFLEGVFKHNQAVCDGFSKAFTLLAGIEGFKVKRITGQAGENRIEHAWNKIKIGDYWYIIDITWFNASVPGKEDGLNWDYLMYTTNRAERGSMSDRHMPDSKKGFKKITALDSYFDIFASRYVSFDVNNDKVITYDEISDHNINKTNSKESNILVRYYEDKLLKIVEKAKLEGESKPLDNIVVYSVKKLPEVDYSPIPNYPTKETFEASIKSYAKGTYVEYNLKVQSLGN